MKMGQLVMYTDGASRGNPGPGGWGAVILVDGYAMEIAGASKRATNNQMELEAVLQVLSDSAAKAYEGEAVVYSDSTYVVNGLTSWIWGWEKKGWVTTQKTPVENKEVWQKLLELLRHYGSKLSVKKVSGHAGELYNERCDELAVEAALGKKQTLFKGAIKDYDAFLKEMGTTKKVESGKKKVKSSTAKKNIPAYSYVSLVDGKVNADKTWAACEKRVKRKKGAKYKKVFSKEEETALIQEYTVQMLL